MKIDANRGFTLIELMAVVVIIAVLSALVLGGVNYAHRKGIDARCAAQYALVQLAIENYKSDHGFYPGVYNAGAAPPTGSSPIDIMNWKNNNLMGNGSCALARSLVQGFNDYKMAAGDTVGKVYISSAVISLWSQQRYAINPGGQMTQNGGTMPGAYRLVNPNGNEYGYRLGNDPSAVNKGSYDLWVYTSIPGKSYRNWKDTLN
jgi:prepilin-type N-terminal cleavage/methylation domain-containing protein